MSELTKEYLDQKLEEKFDEFAQMVARGFENTATKEEVRVLSAKVDDLQFKLDQLTNTVKEFVESVKKLDREYVELKVKYHELESRVARLEGLQPAT